MFSKLELILEKYKDIQLYHSMHYLWALVVTQEGFLGSDLIVHRLLNIRESMGFG